MLSRKQWSIAKGHRAGPQGLTASARKVQSQRVSAEIPQNLWIFGGFTGQLAVGDRGIIGTLSALLRGHRVHARYAAE